MASPLSAFARLLNDGQRASLLAIADRIGSNGVIVADEVGMGKTRIAVFVATAVVQSADSDRSGHLFRSLSGHCYRL
jgi:hypothetical protein